ncbi:MAG: cell division ATP-binding protein FtsE [Oscillospiraceae bacterium]|jgi:cell division transport system ATP-binding protein|nr:cell division ATP-binding protein FtsE [Oscillospiraceae bacterium]
MILFSNVSKEYANGAVALDNVSFTVDTGEFVFVVGHSGAGKSTIMKLIMREEKATSGQIEVNGYDLQGIRRRQISRYRRSIGMVFQDFRLINQMTIYDNVAFALRVTGVVGREIRKRVLYILDLVGLLPKARCFPHQVSGGEQQRVALARALVNNPSIIIADEPTGNIDPELSNGVMELLDEINKCGPTIVVVSHEHNLVKKLNKRVINLENGRMIADTGLGDWFKGEEDGKRQRLDEE